MKKFLIKTFLVSLLPVLIFYWYVITFTTGELDPFYLRFTSGKQHSMILGSSRSAQGIRPDVLNSQLDFEKFQGPIYNYSFTIAHSPYGPSYLNAIRKKLDASTKKGIFILSVDPWSLMTENSNFFDQIDLYPERNLPPGNMLFTSLNPNIEYLAKNYNKPFRQMMYREDTASLLHEDGWLEIRVSMNEEALNKRVKKKQKEYNKKLGKYYPSRKRLLYLSEILKLLKTHGEVIMIRMPVGNEISEIENNFWPNFEQDMKAISNSNGIQYCTFYYLNNNFKMVDGNHLYKEDAKIFTEIICDSLLKKYKK